MVFASLQWSGMESLRYSCTLENGATTLENGLAVPQKAKHSYHMTQQLHFHVYVQEKCPHKNSYTDMYGSHIHSRQKAETMQTLLSE